MMHTDYIAKKPDARGFVDYTAQENRIWQMLYERQMKILTGRACKEYMDGLNALQFSEQTIPQLPDINERIKPLTGWQVKPVAALISKESFFTLLSERFFPAATFIRTLDDLDYIKEPDIFHELFGHCPLLTNVAFADFVEAYARFVLTVDHSLWNLLLRLFWFTVEFGLINTSEGVRAYGGGILSSPEETVYCVDSDIPERNAFTVLDALRTPYRIDILQPVYFVIDHFPQLYDIVNDELITQVKQAKKLGNLPAKFSGNEEIHY